MLRFCINKIDRSRRGCKPAAAISSLQISRKKDNHDAGFSRLIPTVRGANGPAKAATFRRRGRSAIRARQKEHRPMTETQTFSPDARVLLCPQCGAPIDAKPEGGVFTCKYCNVRVMLGSRPAGAIPSAAKPEVSSESHRLDMLRAQEGRPQMAPPDIRYLIHDGELAPDQFNQALQEWQKTRTQLVTEATPAAAERLYFLTSLLQQYYWKQKDNTRLRAVLETASELLTDPRHVQDVRCMLARHAAHAGELDAAEQWLSQCDPRSDDLTMDSTYRFTKALIATRRGQWDDVSKTLGDTLTDIPISSQFDTVCGVLRANAQEQLGHLDKAKTLLIELMHRAGAGPARVDEVIQRYQEEKIALCEKTYPALKQPFAAKKKKSFKFGRIIMVLGFIAGAVMFPMYWVRLPFLPDTKDFRTAMLTIGIIAMSWSFSAFLALSIRAAVVGRSGEKLRLEQVGVPGKGEILAIMPTGWQINHVPQYKLEIQVTVAGKEPYQVSKKVVMHADQVAYFQPGVTLGLKVDPKNPNKVALET